jgi:hypothetical protein
MVVIGACSRPEAISGCTVKGSLEPVCGFRNPEDIELLPDGHTLLISEMGSMDGSAPGSLSLFDTQSGVITRLPRFVDASAMGWGDANCTTPPGAALSPHGIDLVRRADLRWELLVVNHGGRESVEVFEVLDRNGGWHLEWRGCVIPPPGTWMNDVAGLPNGDFLISDMFPREGFSVAGISVHMLRGMLGFDTGQVLRCDPAGSCAPVPGTTAAFPNGIQTDTEGKVLFLNAYLNGEVRKISLENGELLGNVEVEAPDNSQWSADGKLLVASHTDGAHRMNACFGIRSGACAAAFAIVEIDPSTLATRTLMSHAGEPMGAATVAQQTEDALYVGSFVGDRILRVPLASAGLAVTAAETGAGATVP